MEQHTERKTVEVHQHLDTFELWVPARTTHSMDVSTLQAVGERSREDLDMILEARVPESEAPSPDPAEDIVMAALFATSEIPSPTPREEDEYRT